MAILPGNVANPTGINGITKSKPISDALKALMTRDSSDVLNDKAKTIVQELAISLVSKARDGDVVAMREIIDRVEGKAAQSLEVKRADPFDELSTDDLIRLGEAINLRLACAPLETEAGVGKKKIRAL